MNLFRRTFFLFLFLHSSVIYSLNTDTVKDTGKVSLTKWFTENQFEYSDSINELDNSLYDFQRYISKNIIGNIGLAEQNIYYRPYQLPLGFVYSANNSLNYFFSSRTLKYHKTRVPYTDLFYVIGTKREQVFRGTFSYNIRKEWNITADFSRIRSEGSYLRQSTNDNFISLSTNYKSPNNRYWLLSSVIYNSMKNAENGGLTDDTLFFNSGNIDEKLLNVNLTLAKRSAENANVYIKQILNFGKRPADTSAADIIVPTSRLLFVSSIDANSLKYQDDNPSSSYYTSIYYDSTETFDSTFYYNIENELNWKRSDNKKHRGFNDLLGLGFSFKHQLINIKQKSLDTTFNNLIGGFEFFNTYSSHSFWWNLSAKYVLEGYNKDDFHSSLNFIKESNDSLTKVTLKLETRQQNPDFIYNRFLSNHFIWENIFEKSRSNGIEISLKMKKIKFETCFSAYNYKNVLYFDNYSLPRQYNSFIPIFSIFIKKDISFFKWHFDNKIIYQYIPDSTVIRLPAFITENSIYYENYLLKKALLLKIGASIYYTTSYFSNSYMPVSGQFYVQDEKKYGNYPFIDFFINAKVKSVRVFFKIDHLNSGWNGKGYMLTPDYPYPGRTFKLGVSWRFFD